MTLHKVPAPLAQQELHRQSLQTTKIFRQEAAPPIIPRPYQLEMADALDHAIWNVEGPALGVALVAAGKTIILILVSVKAIDRGYEKVAVVSRSGIIAEQSFKTLARLRPDISGGLYTGRRKTPDAQILFATAKTLAKHLDVVRDADLLLIDEADQAFVRDTTKEYSAIIGAARRYAGVTGTPFVLHEGMTVPIFKTRMPNPPASPAAPARSQRAAFPEEIFEQGAA